MTVKGMFVNSDGCIDYARAIGTAIKPVETRTRNMLSALVGERVAIVRTRRSRNPMVIGYVDMIDCEKLSREWLDKNRNLTLIPERSQYDCKGTFKWGYWLASPVMCEPYPLPDNTIRHGRSWCEFEMKGDDNANQD